MRAKMVVSYCFSVKNTPAYKNYHNLAAQINQIKRFIKAQSYEKI